MVRRSGILDGLDQRHVIALEQYLPWNQRSAHDIHKKVNTSKTRTQWPPLALLGLCWQPDLDRIVNDKVHELIESLEESASSVTIVDRSTHPDLPLDAKRELLIKPDTDGGALLEELEDEMDGREQGLASSSRVSSAGHGEQAVGVRDRQSSG